MVDFREALLRFLRGGDVLATDAVSDRTTEEGEVSLNSDPDMEDSSRSVMDMTDTSLSSGSRKRTTGSARRGMSSDTGRRHWTGGAGADRLLAAPSREMGRGLGVAKAERSNGERRLLASCWAAGAGRLEYSWPWRLAPEWRNIMKGLLSEHRRR